MHKKLFEHRFRDQNAIEPTPERPPLARELLAQDAECLVFSQIARFETSGKRSPPLQSPSKVLGQFHSSMVAWRPSSSLSPPSP